MIEKGLAGITINKIASRASLATGTVYIYFDSKDKLVNELYTACRKASAAVQSGSCCYFTNGKPAGYFFNL
ncbi:MAG: TetR/AcrR family transcriptional regulator [Chitinophagaceae bacterium]